jgi:hypothetical protein
MYNELLTNEPFASYASSFNELHKTEESLIIFLTIFLRDVINLSTSSMNMDLLMQVARMIRNMAYDDIADIIPPKDVSNSQK